VIQIFRSGGPVMYPLLACSILALTVIIDRLIFWIATDMRRKQPLLEEVIDLCRAGDWEAVRKKVTGSRKK
jgi:biopolymer transport protein ExbB